MTELGGWVLEKNFLTEKKIFDRKKYFLESLGGWIGAEKKFLDRKKIFLTEVLGGWVLENFSVMTEPSTDFFKFSIPKRKKLNAILRKRNFKIVG